MATIEINITDAYKFLINLYIKRKTDFYKIKFKNIITQLFILKASKKRNKNCIKIKLFTQLYTTVKRIIILQFFDFKKINQNE